MVVRKQVQYYLSNFLEIITKALKIQNDTILIQFGKKPRESSTFHFTAVRVGIATRLHFRSVQFISVLIYMLICCNDAWKLNTICVISFVCMSQPYAHSKISYWGRLHVGGGKYFWFCTAHNPLNMDISLPYKWKSILELAFRSCSLSHYRGFSWAEWI